MSQFSLIFFGVACRFDQSEHNMLTEQSLGLIIWDLGRGNGDGDIEMEIARGHPELKPRLHSGQTGRMGADGVFRKQFTVQELIEIIDLDSPEPLDILFNHEGLQEPNRPCKSPPRATRLFEL